MEPTQAGSRAASRPESERQAAGSPSLAGPPSDAAAAEERLVVEAGGEESAAGFVPAPAGSGAPPADILVVEHSEEGQPWTAPGAPLLDLAAESTGLLEDAEGGDEISDAAHAAGAFTADEPGQESAGEGEEEEEDRADEEGLVLDAIKALKLGGRAEPARPAAAVPRMALPGMVAAAASSAKPGGSGSPRLTARSGLRVSIVGGRKASRFSFSAPPHIPRPKTAVRHNYSHSPQRVRQILRDNESLVRRLGEITYSGSRAERDMEKHDKLLAATAASSAARRQLEAAKIVRQNLALYQRLQAVKPSRDVRREEHRRSFALSRDYVANLSAMKQAPGAGASRRPSQACGPAAPEEEQV